MSFMQPVIYPAAETYVTECAHCCAGNYWHAGVSPMARDSEDTRCESCTESLTEADWQPCGMMYAGRFSAPGYLDCTPWEYNADASALETELEEMYGDDDDEEDEDESDEE